MSKWLPFLIIVIVLVAVTALAKRNRNRQVAAEQRRADALNVGTDVMTTSGLYGTIVARNDDDTVMLSIAPGIEVRWAVAALREFGDLPEQFRPGAGGSRPDNQDAEH